jgi:hypothetical protein
MDFGRAVGVAFSVGSNRRLAEGESDGAEQVSWGHALIGIAILVVVQFGLILWGTQGQFDIEIVRDLSISAFIALVIPFLIFWLAARMTGTMARLPAAFLYLGVSLAALQAISAILASFGTGQSGFLIGLLGAAMFLAARGFPKLGWPVALLVGILVVAGFVGANLLLLMLPTGRLLA